MHQGTLLCPVDFLLSAQSGIGRQDQHDLAIANCLAQAQALVVGRSADTIEKEEPRVAPGIVAHKVHSGDRPSSLISFARLEPETLGALVALYEHKVFVQSLIWDINAFDQWGVELGKDLARTMVPLIDSDAEGPNQVANALAVVRALRRQPH